MLRYFTAGESHGEALVAFLSGLPAGLKWTRLLDRELWRRQQGYGRGGRMKIERDTAHILSGVRHGMTIGSPISVQLENRDWKNWQESLPVGAGDAARHKRVASPRPGHADLAGALKYNFPRLVMSSSALRPRVGGARRHRSPCQSFPPRTRHRSSQPRRRRWQCVHAKKGSWEQIQALYNQEEILLNCADPDIEQRMKDEVDKVLKTGDSLGGVFEVVAHGVPPGLGTYAQWDERLDALLAAAVMSLQAVKAVEIGSGVAAAASPGSAVHDEIGYNEPDGFYRVHPHPQQRRRN
jgi:chorismate synthase